MKTANRWTIAIAGVFLQIALGAVYAWSIFRVPLSRQRCSQKRKEHMSRTIKAIERHMIPRPKRETVQPQMEKNLTAEWQRGLESVTGSAQRKLRLAFAPAHSPALATINH